MHKVLTNREKTILLLTAGVLVFSVLFSLVISPQLDKNDALSRQVRASRVKLKKYAKLLSQKDELQRKYAKLPKGLGVSAKNEGVVGILAELEAFAKEAGIRIVDLRPQPAAKSAAAGYKELAIDLRAEGDMQGYLKFIYALENSLTLLHINKFQLTSKPNSELLDSSFSISHITLSE